MAFDILNAGFAQQPVSTSNNYGGGVMSDPRFLPIAMSDGGHPAWKSNTSTIASVANSLPYGFSSVLPAANTLTNVCSVSGSGFLYHFKTCSAGGSASNIESWINIDGKVYYFAVTMTSVTCKFAWFGALINGGQTPGQQSSASSYSTIYQPQLGGLGDDGHQANSVGKFVLHNLSYYLIPTPFQLASLAMPRIRFEKSLKIDVKTNVAPIDGSATTHGKNAMVQYILD